MDEPNPSHVAPERILNWGRIFFVVRAPLLFCFYKYN